MDIKDIMPFAITCILMQGLVIVYYGKRCWNNDHLSQRERMLYLIAILVFSLPAAAIYLFKTPPIEGDNPAGLTWTESQMREGVFLLLALAFEVFSLQIMSENTNNPHYLSIIWLLAVCFSIMIFNGFLIKENPSIFYYSLSAVQILVILLVEYLNDSEGMQFIVLIVVAGIINNFPLRLARNSSIVAFILYFCVGIIKAVKWYGFIGSDEAVSYLYINAIAFFLVFASFYNLKKQSLINYQLETALTTLKEQSLQLQQMGVLEERNRITGEIHDTVGHTLTSAIISIEAGGELLDQNKVAALEKFQLAKNQIQRGLEDIRQSVRTIQEGRERLFSEKLEALLTEMRQNTDLAINDIVELDTELLPIQQNVLLQSIRECVTNSLKHGMSTEADLLLQEYKDFVLMTFSDNGIGTDNIVFGFGLKNMADRVESIGGTLTLQCVKGEGCTLNISIPTGLIKEEI